VEDARDLTQEAFLKAFQRIGEFRQLSGFYTWVFRIGVNLALSYRRKEGRRKTISLDADSGASGTQADALSRRLESMGDGPLDESLMQAELQAHTARALHDLDDDHRAVIVLRDVEGLDYADIATILEVPPGTVKSRLHRARMAVRQAILPLLREHGESRE
jgi:RNA polymerase sigma-70 factor (ECF subfamily)